MEICSSLDRQLPVLLSFSAPRAQGRAGWSRPLSSRAPLHRGLEAQGLAREAVPTTKSRAAGVGGEQAARGAGREDSAENPVYVAQSVASELLSIRV